MSSGHAVEQDCSSLGYGGVDEGEGWTEEVENVVDPIKISASISVHGVEA